MRIVKCDLCKKNIQGKPITAGVGLLSGVELCEKCGKPVLIFLRKHKFIERPEKEKSFLKYA